MYSDTNVVTKYPSNRKFDVSLRQVDGQCLSSSSIFCSECIVFVYDALLQLNNKNMRKKINYGNV